MTQTEQSEPGQASEYISLTAGAQGYCITITAIREIRRWSTVTPLPRSDPYVMGVMNLRGAVIPIVDLAARMGLGPTEVGERSVVVVVSIGLRTVGLLVDAVSEIISIDEDAIRPNPVQHRDGGRVEITGLWTSENAILRILDLDALFADRFEAAA